MKRWPLRIQFTLLVGLVLVLSCIVLTANSIYSAQNYYGILDTETSIEMIPEGEMAVPGQDSTYAIATHQFSVQSIVVMLAMVLASVILTYFLTRRLLRPLTSLTDSIQHIDQGKLHERVELPQAAGEVQELTESFNSMLNRLENSFEIQKNFAANAAHELKTPIALLKTSLQVLEMDEEPAREDYQDFTTSAKAGIERLSSTVDALMALAMGDESHNTEDIDLRTLTELIFSELKSRAETGRVTLLLSGDCPPVSADPTLVYRAIFNLIENAVKYTPPHGRVEVSISRQKERVQIRVADTGTGMSEEAAAHAFEPFYRADLSRSQQIPGSGLGLSVVKAIVERLHGTVELDSREGKGTTVTLTI